MVLCEICKSVDFRSLLVECLQQCRDRQEAYYGDGDGTSSRFDDSSRVKQHGDIFELENSARDCDLCSVIFQAFERRKVADAEEARGLPIVFRPFQNKIEVCYSSEEGLIKLCGLDVYMDGANANECLRIFQIKEDDSPPILRMIEKDPRSKAAVAVASGWLRNCLKNHSSCNPPAFQNPPKRLINVGNETQNPFLVNTSPASQQIQWLSLSYCWGQAPSMKLTKDTMNTLRNGIALNKLDPTIRDAIIVTRDLEIPYIWIDSLCIVQDQEGKEWNEEASKMNEIYGGSTATLVVLSSSSVMDGFLRERQPHYIPISTFDTPRGDASDAKCPAKAYLSPEWHENEDSAHGPWGSRGWTMQEGLLPSRLLCYTSSQIIWKCCEERRFERGVTKSLNHLLTKTEGSSGDISFGSGWLWELETFMKFKSFPGYLPSRPGNPLLSEPEIFRLWYDLIEEYSPRKFTDIGDRLVALSGLAKVFGKTIRCDEYVAGLWKPDLIRGLMWHTKGARLIPRRFPQSISAANNVFPSWSWASVGFELVKNHQKHNNGLQALSQVRDVQIDLVDPCQPFGEVKNGSIILTGPVRKLTRLYNMAWKSADASMSELERHLSEIVEMESPGGVELRYSSPSGGHFAALQMLEDLYSLDLLVLEATGEVSNGINTYRRVGILTLRFFHEQDVASPRLIAQLEKIENSLASRLGPQRTGTRKTKSTQKVVAELEREPWVLETVTIV